MKFILYLTATVVFTIISIIVLIGCFSSVCKVLEGNYEEIYGLKAVLIITYGVAGPILTIEYVTKAWTKYFKE